MKIANKESQELPRFEILPIANVLILSTLVAITLRIDVTVMSVVMLVTMVISVSIVYICILDISFLLSICMKQQ